MSLFNFEYRMTKSRQDRSFSEPFIRLYVRTNRLHNLSEVNIALLSRVADIDSVLAMAGTSRDIRVGQSF